MKYALAFLSLLTATMAQAGEVCSHADSSHALACFDRLAQCAGVSDPTARLTCYRAGGPATEPEVAAAVTAETTSKLAPAANPVIEDAFPVAGARAGDEGEVPVLSAKVVKIERNAHKYAYLWLDNGHVWREKEKSRFRYKSGDTIIISKGALGSNQLKLEGKTGMVLVERVK